MNLKAGLPYSLIRNGLVTEYPALREDLRTDVVILGGGISGALVAWHLIQAGIPCVVVDARTIGLGSTCASTSLLQYEIDTPLHKLTGMVGRQHASRSYILCREAIDKLINVAAAIGFKDIQRKESLYYAAFKKDVPGLQNEFTARRKLGLDVQYLDRNELFTDTGIAAPGAIRSRTGAQTDAYMFTHALHRAGMQQGLQVFDRTMISGITHLPRSVQLRTETGFTIKARKLVFATGYEIVNYIDKPIVKLHSTYATISEPLSAPRPFWKNECMIWNTADPYLYLRATPDGRVMVGGRDEKFTAPTCRDRLIPFKTKQLKKDIDKIFPFLAFKPEFTWTGTYGNTPDGLPFIGKYHKRPNSYFALGFGGNGITFSLVAAEIIRDELCGRKNGDAAIFSFGRI
jgi:glycine/D-amino acid oxidase-like deaminating enzyme